MPRYRVNVRMINHAYAEVEADTQEDAEEAVHCGDYDDLYGEESGPVEVTDSQLIEEEE